MNDPKFEFRPLRRGPRRGEDPGPERLADLVVPTLARMGLKSRARQVQVASAWAAVVGDAVADHTAVVGYARGRVTVETDSSAMGHQLQLQQQDIVDGLNAIVGPGVVSGLRFRLAAGAGGPGR